MCRGAARGRHAPSPWRALVSPYSIKRAVSFLFGNDPAYNADTESEQQQAFMRAFGRILRDVKCNSVNHCVGGLRAPAKFCLVPVCRGGLCRGGV